MKFLTALILQHRKGNRRSQGREKQAISDKDNHRNRLRLSCKAGKASAHGEPLGEENVKLLRETLGWKYDEAFYVPDEVYQHYGKIAEKGAAAEDAWNRMFAEYSARYPELKAELDAWMSGSNAAKLENDENYWKKDTKANATRNISGSVINYVKDVVKELVEEAPTLALQTRPL